MKRVSSELQVSTSIVALQAGLYALRYQLPTSNNKSGAKPGQPQAVTLARAPIGNATGTVDFFGNVASNASHAELRHPDDCAVFRVGQGGASVLVVEYFADQSAAQNRVEIVIDRLDGDRSQGRLAAEHNTASAASANSNATSTATSTATAPALPYSVKTLSAYGELLPLQFTGHIERRGDVNVAQGWLGAPEATARIEGFLAEWPQQAQTNPALYYGCATSGQQEIKMVPVGTFTGTRGKAQPINSVCFDLQGEDKQNYSLVGQVVFAGSAAQTIHAGKVLSGPSGKEPLVAFYLVTIRKRQKKTTKSSAWEDPAVTQVFRKKDKK
ncbi:MAG: hypothetical protein WD071_14940 [Pseudohongiella sp.]|uniref:hypothetical protein n=1 Tax=Pseudohongiella sp. TaxID=1979412 RepID=UPI0034A00BFF